MQFPKRQNFNFDTALRYYPVVTFLEDDLKTNKDILEVGSGVNGISDFYDGFIVGVDSDFSKTDTIQNKNIKHIKGSITKLPFEEKKFDFVICMDTFEHIKKPQRRGALLEMIRVTKDNGKIILGFPTSDLSQQMEIKINNLHKAKKGFDHIWLKEHRQNGLPEKTEMEEILSTAKIKKFNVIGNTNIYIWFLIHWLYTVNEGSFLSKVLKRFYKVFFYILSLINFGPFYRAIFIIKK